MSVTIREAPFALRVVRRKDGLAAILYRRSTNVAHLDRLDRVTSIGPLAFTAGGVLLRKAAGSASLLPGPFVPLDVDWGARVGCYARVASGLRNGDRLFRAADWFASADGHEAAWWFGKMTNGAGRRFIRALRIIVEAVP